MGLHCRVHTFYIFACRRTTARSEAFVGLYMNRLHWLCSWPLGMRKSVLLSILYRRECGCRVVYGRATQFKSLYAWRWKNETSELVTIVRSSISNKRVFVPAFQHPFKRQWRVKVTNSLLVAKLRVVVNMHAKYANRGRGGCWCQVNFTTKHQASRQTRGRVPEMGCRSLNHSLALFACEFSVLFLISESRRGKGESWTKGRKNDCRSSLIADFQKTISKSTNLGWARPTVFFFHFFKEECSEKRSRLGDPRQERRYTETPQRRWGILCMGGIGEAGYPCYGPDL